VCASSAHARCAGTCVRMQAHVCAWRTQHIFIRASAHTQYCVRVYDTKTRHQQTGKGIKHPPSHAHTHTSCTYRYTYIKHIHFHLHDNKKRHHHMRQRETRESWTQSDPRTQFSPRMRNAQTDFLNFGIVGNLPSACGRNLLLSLTISLYLIYPVQSISFSVSNLSSAHWPACVHVHDKRGRYACV
jgi:hypothetical protein